MAEEPQAPIQGQPTEPEAKAEGAQSQVPEKFKGKSAEEIATAYEELSKTIGRQGEELGLTKKELKERDEQINKLNYLVQVIESDETLFAAVTSKIKGKPQETPPAEDEVKQTITSNVIKEFERKYGLDKLDQDKAQAIRTAIGQKVERLTGKSIQDVPLSQLAETLESGYTLATQNDREEQARLKGIAEARENQEAEFGSIPSTGVQGQQKTITPEEHRAAQRFGMTDEEYLKYKDK